MRRTAPLKPVAWEAPTSNGRRVRFTARVEPGLSFDACDALTGEALGQISVWNANPELADRPRMLERDDWNLESRVHVEIVALDKDGQFYRAVNGRVGALVDMFDALLAITEV